jgi:hypothetical protein
MAWGTPTDARTPIGARIDFERAGVGDFLDLIDDDDRREVVA